MRCRDLSLTAGIVGWCLTAVPAQEPKPPEMTSTEKARAEQALKKTIEGARLHRSGQAADAVAPLTEALRLYQQAFPVHKFPRGHPRIAESLNNLGRAFGSMASYEQARPCYEQALAMRRSLFPTDKFPAGHADIAESLGYLAGVLLELGACERARLLKEQTVAMYEKVYPADKFPNGHLALAHGIHNLGALLVVTGEYDHARPHFERAHAMLRQLYQEKFFPDGHADLAGSLDDLGTLHAHLGDYDRARSYCERAMAMRRKLYPAAKFPDGHVDLAFSLNHVGITLYSMRAYGQAKPYLEHALEMLRTLYPAAKYPNGNPYLAASLDNLGALLAALGEVAQARALHEQALEMRQRLYPEMEFPCGHADVIASLNNLGHRFNALGDYAQARSYFERALAMSRKLYPVSRFPDGHPNLQTSLNNVGAVLMNAGTKEPARPYLEQSLAMSQRLLERDMQTASEAQILGQIAAAPEMWNNYFSAVASLPGTEESSFVLATARQGRVLDLLQRRHHAALLARSQSEQIRQDWNDLADARRQIARLVLSPGPDLADRDRRMAELNAQQEKLERQLAAAIPALQISKRSSFTTAVLIDRLPPKSAFLQFVRYQQWEKDRSTGPQYVAFIVAPERPVQRTSLGEAGPIDEAIVAWRKSIAAREMSAAPAVLKRLLWDKLAPVIPPGTKTLFICPDGDLARLPFAALPGRRPDSVMLEDFALAIVPSPRWLLEQLTAAAAGSKVSGVLAVGGVDYGPAAGLAAFPPLGETAREMSSVLAAFDSAPNRGLTGRAVTIPAIRERLPQVRYAHFATHGFFDANALAAEQRRLEQSRKHWQIQPNGTRPVGLGLKNPLAYVGLALSGSNDPKADGILTGLSILDLPLENLNVVTLSACQTGLGDLTGGEGVQGLQRAFHLAGCPNVIASLWNVNDAATAALMAKFYHELWINKKPPIEALREAQLTIFHHPELIPDLAGERGAPKLKEAVVVTANAPIANRPGSAKRADTKLWAAFVLSGVGK